jgi:3-oxoacyl-(acyl-carrier-protein) synthase
MRRVVVTGLGLVTPIGADVETVWANLLAGKSGAGQITKFDASDFACTIACEVRLIRSSFTALMLLAKHLKMQVSPT